MSIAAREIGPGGDGSFIQTLISLGPPNPTHAPSPPPGPAEVAVRADAFENASPKQLDLTGRTIAGYKVTAMLGAGGMGAVCLAHQVSLDRDVALKILPAKMARNPDFLMRFTREALSAARMTHHNIIQIYDIGNDANIHYISMEFVRGRTLGQIMRDEGQLDAPTAAGYILQAARGLEYAHRRGIIHRDIKPDNLMINEHGILKIADMGLAKMLSEAKRTDAAPAPSLDEHAEALKNATGNLTMGDIAMGTPSYMPPEQARDAGSVDHRADQYSLGCTFYALLTGQAPFTGSSAYELIHQHLLEDAPPVENLARETPPAVSRIIARMLVKDPDERFPDMTAVIRDIEDYMGLEAGRGARIPNQGHVKFLEDAQADYYGVAAGRRRKRALIAFGAGIPALGVVSYSLAFFISPTSNAGACVSWALGTMLLAPVCKFLREGIREKTYFFRRLKNFIAGMSWKEWLGAAAAILLVVLIIGPITFFVSLASAFGLALAYESLVKKPVRLERAHPVEEINRLLKELRILGLGENALQSFVAGYSGDDWEEFYEELFGYESMIGARERIQQTNQGKPRKTVGVWRDPVLRVLGRIEEKRKSRREKSRLSDLEAQRLEAEGMGGTEARRRANEMASMIVNEAMWEDEVTPTPLPAPRGDRAAARDSAPIKQAAPKTSASSAPLPARGRRRSDFGADQLLRAVCGLTLCVLYAMPAAMKTGMLPAFIFKGSLALSPLGLVAGVMLLASALSSRKGYGLTLLIGAALFTFHVPLQAMLPKNLAQYDPLGVGIIVMALGFLPPCFGKLRGKPY